MKVYFINSVVDYGSTGKIVRDLSNELKNEGHSVRIAYGRHDAKQKDDTLNLSTKLGFAYHYFMSRFFGRHGLHSTPQTHKLIKDIKDFNPDCIHIHNVHGYYLNVPLLLKELKKMDVKILWTLHDAWLISGSSAYFDYSGCKTWDNGCVECNSTKDYPRADFIKRQKKNFAWKKTSLKGFKNLTFITPSEWLKNLISDTFLNEYPCVVVNNGIDTSVFKPQMNQELENQFKEKKVLLGVASIWERRKGLDDFIALDQLISDEYIIVLIGLSSQQIQDLPDSIVGIERTSDANELAQYYSLAHAYLNPTYEDNYPTTNLEALACNTPVIAYDTGGNKEVKTLITVSQGDIKALYEEVRNLPNPKIQLDTSDLSKEHFAKLMMKLY